MLRIGEQMVAPRLVILDKDGTLMAFDEIWHTWFRHLLRALQSRVTGSDALSQGLAETLGYDPATDHWDPVGPLTLASTREVGMLIAGQIYRYTDQSWPQALATTRDAEAEARKVLHADDLVQPVGDVVGFCRRLRAAGCVLAIATTDDREATERNLAQLGIKDLIAAWVCGDDGIPLKPAPDMALTLCERLEITPQETVVVGDTIADMDMARAAGCLLAVGVGTGAVPAPLLAEHADVMLPDIHAMATLPEEA